MPNYQTPYSGSDYASQIAELIGKQGVNPYAGTLIDLMRQHGAATQAAMQQQGAAKAQQWQNLGNVLDKTLTSIQQQPERARAAQMQQLELSNAQGAAEDQRADRAIGQAMRQAQLPDGTFDLAKFDQSVATISNGRRVVEARTALQGANAGASAAAVQALKSRDELPAHIFKTAFGAGRTPDAVIAAAAPWVKRGLVSQDVIDRGVMALEEADPSTLDRLWYSLSGQDYKTTERDPNKEVRGPNGELISAAAPKEKPVLTLDQQIAQAGRPVSAGGDTVELKRLLKIKSDEAAATRAPGAPVKVMGTDGVSRWARPESAIGARTDGEGGLVPPGASSLTGEEFLKALPPALATQIRKLADGSQPFPTGMSMAKMQPLIQAVGQYDPTFDAGSYQARAKLRAELAKPTSIINAMNTALQHVGTLSDKIEELGNSDVPSYNAIANPIRTAFGGTGVTNFDAVQPQAMKEIERLWRGSGGSAGEIDALKESLSSGMGRQQQVEALNEFASLIEGKLRTTEQQRDGVMGAYADKLPIIFPGGIAVIEKVRARASGEDVPPAAGNPYR